MNATKDATKVTLKAVGSLGEAAAAVPFLSPAARIVVMIIESAEQAHYNKADCMKIGLRASQIMEDLADALKDEQSLDPQLNKELDRLEQYVGWR